MMVVINFLGWALVGMTLAVLIMGLAVLLRLMLATAFE